MPVTDTQCLCVGGLHPKSHRQYLDRVNLFLTLKLALRKISGSVEKNTTLFFLSSFNFLPFFPSLPLTGNPCLSFEMAISGYLRPLKRANTYL